MSVIALSASPARSARRYAVPIVVGILAALAMIAVYLGILSVLQSPEHAMEQLVADGVWVGLVALGFGVQIGVNTFLRVVIHAAKAAGTTAVTGAGTGTCTLGMLACCAHHLTDLAPLVALTGASGLSGAVGFLTEWKYAFIALGLFMNAVGIAVTIRTARSVGAHLGTMTGAPTEIESAAACH